MATKDITKASQVLERAEVRLAKATANATASLEKATNKAIENATKKSAEKITKAETAVDVARTSLQALVAKA